MALCTDCVFRETIKDSGTLVCGHPNRPHGNGTNLIVGTMPIPNWCPLMQELHEVKKEKLTLEIGFDHKHCEQCGKVSTHEVWSKNRNKKLVLCHDCYIRHKSKDIRCDRCYKDLTSKPSRFAVSAHIEQPRTCTMNGCGLHFEGICPECIEELVRFICKIADKTVDLDEMLNRNFEKEE